MKTSVIQNCCLSLIVIEAQIHQHIIYNEKAAAFKEQFDRCVDIVLDLNEQFGTTRQLCEQIDKQKCRDQLEESSRDQLEESKFNTEHLFSSSESMMEGLESTIYCASNQNAEV